MTHNLDFKVTILFISSTETAGRENQDRKMENQRRDADYLI